jgi:4-diphosphocytidyl-2-C-methyl-D-erythritol kinase
LNDCAAPAKLNLFLHVTGRREDGYHLLQSVFQLIDLQDTLHFTLRDDQAIVRTTDIESLPPEQDLTVRAARLLQSEAQARGLAVGGAGGSTARAAREERRAYHAALAHAASLPAWAAEFGPAAVQP